MGFGNNRVVSANQVEGLATERNVFSNAEAEENVTGFSQYLGTVNGPNGNFTVTGDANFTLTTTPTTPLSLSNSYQINGNNLSGYHGHQKQFTPPRKDIRSAANYEISFAYELVSGVFSGSLNEGVPSDVWVALWDDFNNVAVPLSTRNLQPMIVGGVFVYKATFQLAPNATTYRICLHRNVSGNTFQLEVDDFEISLVKSTGVVMRPPVGSLIAHSSVTPPTGYLYCNGQTVSRTTYSRLFASIGTTYGTGDGSTTFHVPDFRGRFLRGVDQGINRDPDRASRAAMNTGGASGDNVGSVQTDTFISHSHGGITGGQTSDHQHIEGWAGVNAGASYGVATAGAPGNINQQSGQSASNHALTSGTTANHAHGISAEGGSETRPENANVAFHICFDDGNSQIAGTSVWADDVGSVHAFAIQTTTIPDGYLLCNGAAVSRVTYGDLFRKIGTLHGSGDGSTTFNLPDYRGRFLRGQNLSSGRDPDAGGRVAMNTGGITGDNVGSIQGFAFQAHVHGVNDPGHAHPVEPYGSRWTFNPGGSRFRTPYTVDGNNDNIPTAAVGTGISIGAATGTTSANETRPLNAYVNYFIKYARTQAPIQIAPQSVFARANQSSGQSIPANTVTIVNFSNVLSDRFGLITTGANWRFTAKEYGIYEVEAGVLITGGNSLAATAEINLSLLRNNLDYKVIDSHFGQVASTASVSLNGYATVELQPNEWFDLRIFHQFSGASNLITQSRWNYIDIYKK